MCIMANWEKDIHRIQEIHQLLEDRQRYFSGHLNTSCYKLDRNGNPMFFPKMHSTNKTSDSNDPSLGHSVEANFGSTDSGSINTPLDILREKEGESVEKGGVLSDSSDGHCADHSQNESSDASFSANGKELKKKKVIRKNPKALRKWVTKNVEVTSAAPVHTKANATRSKGNIESRKSSMLRFKSVSFEDESAGALEELNEIDYHDILNTLPSTRTSKKKKSANPINLLRRRSWILKAEMTSRLKNDAKDLNLNKVITGLTKSSISNAREKLKKAERSLRATVKNEHKIPVFKKQKQVKAAVAESKNQVSPTIPKTKVLNNAKKHVNVSRLALRQQEEALRSDLNLREAFALIKIDPDPLLKLASVENESKPSHKSSTLGSEKGTVTQKPLRGEDKFRHRVTLDDSKTTQTLQRLTKLSIQHLQKQQSLIPNSVQPLPIKLKKVMDKSLKSQRNMDLTKSFEFSRRKSSTTSTSSVQQKILQKQSRRSKNCVGERDPKLPTSGKTANGRGERRESKVGEPLGQYAFNKLAGTVI